MGELGRLDAKAFEDQQVLEGVGKVILAADDVADAEIGVVGAGGEVVGGHPVPQPHRRRPVGGDPGRTQQGEVFHLVGELGLLAVNAIDKAEGTAFTAGDAIAKGEGLAGWRRGGRTLRWTARAFRG